MRNKNDTLMNMARKSDTLAGGRTTAPPLSAPKISLTLTQGASGQLQVHVGVGELIAYSQNLGFTRLNLTGRKVLDVKETTDQIDRLVRKASHQIDVPANSSTTVILESE